MKENEMRLFYRSPAADSLEGWERYSLPIGNGKFGASVFGGVEKERVIFATNEFANNFPHGGLSEFSEIHLLFDEKDVKNYERSLSLETGVVASSFEADGNSIHRECFCSYPDQVLVYRWDAKKPCSFQAKLVIPFLDARTPEEGGRTGRVYAEGETLVMRGTLPLRDLIYEGRLSYETDGECRIEGDSFFFDHAKTVILYYTAGTSYRLCPEAFMTHKALGEDPEKSVKSLLKNAKSLGYPALKERHIQDYQSWMGRVTFSLSSYDPRPTDELLKAYQAGENVPYLEMLYFQFGRHLLLSSSRPGTLPASLQGVWTAYDKSPWGSGFWHNINVQMNYWPALVANLDDTFVAYRDFFKAYLPAAEKNAQKWFHETYPDKPVPEDAGWIVGTGVFAYEVEGLSPKSHSGPGTGALTSALFYDAYAFTEDLAWAQAAYEAVHGMEKFLLLSVKKYDDAYLCSCSASPEQILSGHWELNRPDQQYYRTIGCAFDEQGLEQNARYDLVLANAFHQHDAAIEQEKKELGHYQAVEIGYSGQIKEYGEEHFYGEIGEYHHRHLSQLVGLMPGNIVNHQTPAWLDAARLTLTYRGDFSTGWALAHRLCAWARVGDGDHAYLLLRTLLSKKTHPNLWDVHPPFQIDGNFGALTGICEMLLQSHEGYLSLLPALPSSWKDVDYHGLKARGCFEISLSYHDHRIQSVTLTSLKGNPVRLCAPGLNQKVEVLHQGTPVATHWGDGFLCFETKIGETYTLNGFEENKAVMVPTGFKAEYETDGVRLSWDPNQGVCHLYRATDSEAHYKDLGLVQTNSFVDPCFSLSHKGRITYKLVLGDQIEKVVGALAVLSPASELEYERYQLRLKVNNLMAEKIGWSE